MKKTGERHTSMTQRLRVNRRSPWRANAPYQYGAEGRRRTNAPRRLSSPDRASAHKAREGLNAPYDIRWACHIHAHAVEADVENIHPDIGVGEMARFGDVARFGWVRLDLARFGLVWIGLAGFGWKGKDILFCASKTHQK